MSSLQANTGIKSRERKRLLIGLLFISPWIFGFLVFQLYPIIMSLYYSFTEYNLFNAPEWVGLSNYMEMTKDAKMYQSLYNTIFITIFGFFPQLIYALGIALLLNQSVKGLSIYRTIYFLPTLVPAVASSLLWMWLLNAQYGLINQALGAIGLPEPNWLLDANWTKPSLIFMGFWGTGTTTIMYLAALQEVPKMYYEAASIDGASRWRKFWHITLPAISPMTFFLIIMGLIGSFQYFSQGYVFADSSGQAIGGPSNSILFYAIYLFQNAFVFLKMGYASAMAWLLFVVVLILTLVVFRSSGKWVFYGGDK
ncbi:carbohydrate ABC transporter permease [Paenibacillus aquistagni]|uniref:Carbohydrate ABC transporter membrane protein 1, CUT1 family n=1 Tax=Paenibacillus aquistagni TaxID=1852522 RepID=A0A1X7KP99_9BACL|nr:sugar ABC transporter permease [Paenibacillus aquistagni]NMM52359.1 sugar ABC transporter permease [Paenibacillus aquistagni]SMG42557.1 carbohydrate ABC transporter membrane protein 1, CUT1 family [Paenibacillus aquistagni]